MAKATRKKSEKPAASLIEGNKETPIAIEEIPAPQALAIIPAEKKAEMEIARFDVARNWIAEKKAEYEHLAIHGLDDKTGHKAVTAAWQEIRNKRLQVQNKHKEIKADYLVITRKIDGEKNDLVALLEEIENPLKSELDRIEEEKEAAKKEEERKIQEKLQGRVDSLIANGMAFNGRYYGIGDVISIDIVTLKELADDEFGKLLERVQKENQTILDAQAAKEQREKEERDAQEKKRLELEETERQQKEKQAELDRQQEALDKQKADMLAARTKARGKLLEAVGMTYNFSNRYFEFNSQDFGGIKIAIGGVEGMEDEQWEPEYDSIADSIKGLKAQQTVKDKERLELEETDRQRVEKEKQEAEAKRVLLATRKSELMAYYGMKEQADGTFIRKFDFPEITPLLITKSQIENYETEPWEAEKNRLTDDKFSALKMQEGLQKKKNEAEELARQSALSDAERVREFVNGWSQGMMRKPEITDPKIAAAFASFDTTVAGALEDLLNMLDSIK